MYKTIKDVVFLMKEEGRDVYKKNGKQLSDVHFLTEFYRTLKGYNRPADEFEEEFRESFGFINKYSKKILNVLDLGNAMSLVFTVFRWASYHQLEWTITTCIKKWDDYKDGALEIEDENQPFKRDSDFYCKTLDGRIIQTQQELESLAKSGSIYYDEIDAGWKSS